jgi:hypothetical protein
MAMETTSKIDEIITPEGLKVSGNGIIIQCLNKIAEQLEKIDKKLYFMEKRQQDWFENYVKKKELNTQSY